MKNTSPLNIEFLNLKDVNRPYEDDIRQALSQVTDSGWYLYGHNVKRFEQDWAEYCGAKYCVACGNGLDALTLVLKAWQELGRISIGDEVIVPANTYIATILAVSECGLIPVLVEPDPETYLISANSILNAITERTRAILPVHLYGQMCDNGIRSRLKGIFIVCFRINNPYLRLAPVNFIGFSFFTFRKSRHTFPQLN